MQTVVVYDRKTRDVLAAIPLKDGETAICRKDVEFTIYHDTEPVFTETPTGPKLKTNAFILMPEGMDHA